jgi:hypothetical protein
LATHARQLSGRYRAKFSVHLAKKSTETLPLEFVRDRPRDEAGESSCTYGTAQLLGELAGDAD